MSMTLLDHHQSLESTNHQHLLSSRKNSDHHKHTTMKNSNLYNLQEEMNLLTDSQLDKNSLSRSQLEENSLSRSQLEENSLSRRHQLEENSLPRRHQLEENSLSRRHQLEKKSFTKPHSLLTNFSTKLHQSSVTTFFNQLKVFNPTSTWTNSNMLSVASRNLNTKTNKE